ncbi:gene transfer agent family protein [Brevundimonas sp. S30B]|uniref:gene transfer agent family protein n=1 Tax=unclassified Brevundimonas TaxID=2622653 RepID=UPI0010729410|nr:MULTISPECIES: gene transfer agent family protein [unclassified Brevundimonas]QBX38671.1 gene transfer agent family protein [Brevundimonas sp. MF30-B]TFW01262.1 gene transfer agent family protein [Brevundimonas sp. S30B]
MSRSAEISLAFGGEERSFRLPIGRLRPLQEKVDAGPMELLQRFAAGTWRVDDLRETILQGLIGGGLDQAKASRLVIDYFDDQPLQPFVTLAQAIIMAAVVGAEDEELGEPRGEEATSSPSPKASSGSAESTEQPAS